MPGLNPKLWGPPWWAVLHGLAHASDTLRSPEPWQNFITSIQHVLPCSACRTDFAEHLSALRSSGIGSDNPAKLMFQLHNRVRSAAAAELGTPCTEAVTFEELQRRQSLKGAPGFSRGELEVVLLSPALCLASGGTIDPEHLKKFYISLGKVLGAVEHTSREGLELTLCARGFATGGACGHLWAQVVKCHAAMFRGQDPDDAETLRIRMTAAL